MPIVRLDDRAVVSVSGPDAEHFLQNIITADLAALRDDEAKPSALLTPQGKILFDFLVSRQGANALRLETRADVADDLVRRLTLYKLRAKVDISKQDESLVSVSWGSDSTSSHNESTWLRDSRFPATAPAWRTYQPAVAAQGSLEDWHAFRVAAGVAESGVDYALGDAFPHDVLLEQMGGVGMRKGCYVGQEVVSRMQHRGTARRRVLIVSGAPLPAPGTDVVAAERPIGSLGTVAGDAGIAILRIDRVKDALDSGTPIVAGGTSLSVAIPKWATFTFPEHASGEDG